MSCPVRRLPHVKSGRAVAAYCRCRASLPRGRHHGAFYYDQTDHTGVSRRCRAHGYGDCERNGSCCARCAVWHRPAGRRRMRPRDAPRTLWRVPQKLSSWHCACMPAGLSCRTPGPLPRQWALKPIDEAVDPARQIKVTRPAAAGCVTFLSRLFPGIRARGGVRDNRRGS